MRNFIKSLMLLIAVAAGAVAIHQKYVQKNSASPERSFAVKNVASSASHRQNTQQGWSQKNLQSHWSKHRAEFPEFKSAAEYGDFALKFFRDPPPGTLRKTRGKNGDRLYYHPESNIFGATTSGGIPKTMFRPDKGIRYWKRQ